MSSWISVRVVGFMETESRRVVSRAWGERVSWIGLGFVSILEMDGGDGLHSMQICFKSLKCTLANGSGGKFYMYFTFISKTKSFGIF